LLLELAGRCTSRGAGEGAEWFDAAPARRPRLVRRADVCAAGAAAGAPTAPARLLAMADAVARAQPADDLALRFLPFLAAAEAEAEAAAAAAGAAGSRVWRLTQEACLAQPAPAAPPPPRQPRYFEPPPRVAADALLRALGVRAPPARALLPQAQLAALLYAHLRCDDVVRALRVLTEASAHVAADASAGAVPVAAAEAALRAAADAMQARLAEAAALLEDVGKASLLPTVLCARLHSALLAAAAAATQGARWLGG
jgi:hypothetical protein